MKQGANAVDSESVLAPGKNRMTTGPEATCTPLDLPLRVEQISYEELLRYERLYDRERMPVRFESDSDADWEYLDYRFYAAYDAYFADTPTGFTGMALTRRVPGRGPCSVYHRSSYTLPRHRCRGVWSALWTHKLSEISRLGWATAATEVWVLTRRGDLRYRHRGFVREGIVVHRYKDEPESYNVWTATWGELLENPANQVGPNRHVLLHP